MSSLKKLKESGCTDTFGPEQGDDSSKLLDATFRYHEYLPASTAFPANGFAGLPTASGSVATIWRAKARFKRAMNATRLAFLRQDTPPPVGEVYVLHGPSSSAPANFSVINTSAQTAPTSIRIPHGGWFGVFSKQDSNSHIYFVNAAPVDITVGDPAAVGPWFAITRSSLGPAEPRWPAGLNGIQAGDEYTVELVHYGVSLLSTVASPADLLRQVQNLIDPPGLRLVRGQQKPTANRSHGLVDLVAEPECGCVEVTATKNPDERAMLPVQVSNLYQNWTVGLHQLDGYSLGNYGPAQNRYSALAMDGTAEVHVPLYTGLAKHQVTIGHPATLAVSSPDGASVQPCELFVQVTHVDSVPGASDVWHVSVQNPLSRAVRVRLQIQMDLPHFALGGGANASEFAVPAGAIVDVV